MTVYRFAAASYSNDISGEGARLYGGRWNSIGIPVVYTSQTISLSLLEMLIHTGNYEEIKSKKLVSISIPEHGMERLPVAGLPKNWQSDIDYCRDIGDSFLTSGKSLLLSVPSAIVPEEMNILINPRHPLFKKISVVSARGFNFDSRMFKN
jgi:RES domain-containing protein